MQDGLGALPRSAPLPIKALVLVALVGMCDLVSARLTVITIEY
jgi:hypothetical protein